MKRFVLVTFGFLGWAFYEMSGGSDFESASDRFARLQPAPEVKVTQVNEIAPVVVAKAVIDTDPPQTSEVTRVSLNLTSLQVADDPAPQIQKAAIVDAETGVALNVGLTLSSADTPAIIPSLIAPNDTGAATFQNATLDTSPNNGVRKVSGNRVNVRGGPGTDFGIVGRLVRGDTVEIIEDNGNGWVLMRSVDNDTQGWLADFLLTSGQG